MRQVPVEKGGGNLEGDWASICLITIRLGTAILAKGVDCEAPVSGAMLAACYCPVASLCALATEFYSK